MEPALRKTYANLISKHVRGAKSKERKERKHIYSQTSRLENPEELQLHHNHAPFLFLNVLLLFAQRKIH
jgi:hypothetical protein